MEWYSAIILNGLFWAFVYQTYRAYLWKQMWVYSVATTFSFERLLLILGSVCSNEDIREFDARLEKLGTDFFEIIEKHGTRQEVV